MGRKCGIHQHHGPPQMFTYLHLLPLSLRQLGQLVEIRPENENRRQLGWPTLSTFLSVLYSVLLRLDQKAGHLGRQQEIHR